MDANNNRGFVDPRLSTPPVARIETASGVVTILRVDEVLVAAPGDPVYDGDMIYTDPGSAVGIQFLDGSAFAMQEDSRCVLDEAIYDPASNEGHQVIRVLEGSFVYDRGDAVSDEPTLIRALAATISAQTGEYGLRVSSDGGLHVTLLGDPDGSVGTVTVANALGTQLLHEPSMEVAVLNADTPPSWPIRADVASVRETYGVALASLPGGGAVATQWAVHEPVQVQAGGAPPEGEPEATPQVRVVAGEDVGRSPEASRAVSPPNPEIQFPEPPAAAPSADRRDVASPQLPPNLLPEAEAATVATLEDQPVAGQLTARDADNDTLTFRLAAGGSPQHGTVTLNADGSYTYHPDANFSGEDRFTFAVSDSRGGVATAPVTVNVAPIADIPALTVADTVGAEDTAIPLSVSAALTDSSETLDNVIVSGVPAGARLSAGIDRGDGTWSLAPDELAGLTITPPAHASGEFHLSFTASSTEPQTGETASITDSALLVVNPVADVPYLEVEPTSGTEDISVPLTITTTLVDPSETLRVEISGLPAGASLNAGIESDGIWRLTPSDLTDLRLLLPHDFGESFQLSVTAISAEETGEAATPVATLGVTMTPTGDVSLSVDEITRPETNSAVVLPLNLHAAVTDVDASETLTQIVVTFDQDLPTGAVVAGGTLDGRVLTIPADNIDSVSVTVPADWSGTIDGTAIAHTNEGESTPAAVALHATAVPDVPSLSLTVFPDEAATAAARGGFVSVWEDPNLDDAGTAIIAQRFDAAGAPTGPEFRVNTVTAGSQVNPSAATLASGGFVVVWESPNLDGNLTGIAMQRYFASGNPAGPETVVNTYTTGGQNNAQVAALGDGGFVVAWDGRGVDDTQGIFARRFDATGAPVAGDFRVSSTISGSQTFPSLASLADGGFVVLWEGAGTGDTAGIYGQRYDAAGSAVGSEFRANTTTTQTQDIPDVTALDNGGFVAVWHGQGTGDTNGIFMRYYGADGLPVGTETLVNATATGTQTHPSVETLADGSFIVTWNGRGADDLTGIYAQRFDATGARLGGEFRVNTTTSNVQDFPSITPLANGGFVVNWESSGQDGSTQGIFAQRFDGNAQPVGSEFQVNTTIQGAQADPAASGLTVGGNYFDVSFSAAFGDYLDASERHQVRIDVPDGFSLLSDPGTWADLPSGVTAELLDGDIVLTAETGSEGIAGFSYSFPVVQDDLTVATASFAGEAQATELSTGEMASTAAQADVIIGTEDSDVLSGTEGAETIYGGTGADTIAGSGGSDAIYGGEDSDVVSGDAGNDELYGGAGDDTLAGGEGDDLLAGGAGDDVLSGGEGGDTYLYRPGEENEGSDIISDFEVGDQIRIETEGFGLDDINLTQQGDDAIVTIIGHDIEITLQSVDVDHLVSYQLTPDPESDIIIAYESE